MKLMITMIAVLTATTFPLFAQTAEELKTQMTAAEKQMVSIRQELRKSPECQQAQKDMMEATKAYDEALSKVPEIAEMDKKLAELQQEKRDLVKKRLDKETDVASTTLAKEKATKDEAERKLRESMTSKELEQAKAQMRAISVQISQAEQAKP